VVATYIGVAFFAVLYVGYAIYQRIKVPEEPHFVPLLAVDLDSDAVWGKGQGEEIREREEEERKQVLARGGWRAWKERYAFWLD
jgi:amino acid permease